MRCRKWSDMASDGKIGCPKVTNKTQLRNNPITITRYALSQCLRQTAMFIAQEAHPLKDQRTSGRQRL